MPDNEHLSAIRHHAHALGEDSTCAFCRDDAKAIEDWAAATAETKDIVARPPDPRVAEVRQAAVETRDLARERYSSPKPAAGHAPQESRRGPLGSLVGMDRPGDLVRGVGGNLRKAIPRPLQILTGRSRRDEP